MTKYRVALSKTITVEAESKEEAMTKACNFMKQKLHDYNVPIRDLLNAKVWEHEPKEKKP